MLRTLLPFSHFILISPLSPREIAEKLQAELATKSTWFWDEWPGVDVHYAGSASETGFELKPIRRVFRLVLQRSGGFGVVTFGGIARAGGGSRIEVRQRPSWFVVAIMTIVVGTSLVHFELLEILLLGIVLAVMVRFGFWPEAQDAKEWLKSTLNASIET